MIVYGSALKWFVISLYLATVSFILSIKLVLLFTTTNSNSYLMWILTSALLLFHLYCSYVYKAYTNIKQYIFSYRYYDKAHKLKLSQNLSSQKSESLEVPMQFAKKTSSFSMQLKSHPKSQSEIPESSFNKSPKKKDLFALHYSKKESFSLEDYLKTSTRNELFEGSEGSNHGTRVRSYSSNIMSEEQQENLRHYHEEGKKKRQVQENYRQLHHQYSRKNETNNLPEQKKKNYLQKTKRILSRILYDGYARNKDNVEQIKVLCKENFSIEIIFDRYRGKQRQNPSLFKPTHRAMTLSEILQVHEKGYLGKGQWKKQFIKEKKTQLDFDNVISALENEFEKRKILDTGLNLKFYECSDYQRNRVIKRLLRMGQNLEKSKKIYEFKNSHQQADEKYFLLLFLTKYFNSLREIPSRLKIILEDPSQITKQNLGNQRKEEASYIYISRQPCELLHWNIEIRFQGDERIETKKYNCKPGEQNLISVFSFYFLILSEKMPIKTLPESFLKSILSLYQI